MPARPDAPPLFALVDLLARRHGLALFWALRERPAAFTDLVRGVDAPDSVVRQRLRELRDAGLLEVDESGDYRLTTYGRRLLDPLQALAGFADQWDHLSPRQRTPRGSADRGRGEG